MGIFTKNTMITFVARVFALVLGLGTSIVIARNLGPENKGIYSMAFLLPSLIATFAHLGIGPATVYNVAQRRYPRQEILGNNILLGLGIGVVGVFSGLAVAIFFRQSVFPGVAQRYLMLSLAFIPPNLLFVYVQNVLLGAQRFKGYNLIVILHALLFLVFIVVALWAFRAGVAGTLIAGALAWFLTDILLFLWTRKVTGGISFNLNPAYLRDALVYGIQAHPGNILTFLYLRIDMFFINALLNPTAVGFYSVGVGLVEKLSLVSQAASTVLFPKVAGETDEQRRKEFTPLVARTVLWVTALGAFVIFLLSHWIVKVLYSAAFLPAVRPLQILLLGIVALGVARVLGNDIAGRGRPVLNTYVSVGTLASNIVLNIIWIPRYGIAGAAWASTVSYSLTLLARLFLYWRLSGNAWTQVLLPQRGDWTLYRRTGLALGQWVKAKVRAVL